MVSKSGWQRQKEKADHKIMTIQMPDGLFEKIRNDSLEKKVTIRSIVRKALEAYLHAH